MNINPIELEYALAKQHFESLGMMNIKKDIKERTLQDVEYERARLRLENARAEYSRFVRELANKARS